MLLPLKQGLKPGFFNDYNEVTSVVMLLPLKQGLKPASFTIVHRMNESCYATSIKTRIETFPAIGYIIPPHTGCYATSIKTRIETKR